MTTAAEFREAANKIIAADIIHSDEVVTLLWEAARQAEAIAPAMSEQQTADEIVEVVSGLINDAADDIYYAVEYARPYDFDGLARAAIAAARPMIEAEERERCATICQAIDERRCSYGDFEEDLIACGAEECASAIRAMGVER